MLFCVFLQVSGALERLAVSPALLTLNLKVQPSGDAPLRSESVPSDKAMETLPLPEVVRPLQFMVTELLPDQVPPTNLEMSGPPQPGSKNANDRTRNFFIWAPPVAES